MTARGYIDRCSRFILAGWATGEGETTAELIVEVDGVRAGRFTADNIREDLKQGRGFKFQFDRPLPQSAKTVRVYFAATGQDLTNSPFDLKHRLRAIPASELAWANGLEMPDSVEMRQIGSNSVEIFLQQGTRMANVVAENITEFFGHLPSSLNVLDFGCGVGRVLLPLTSMMDANWHACDVNDRAIDYIQRVVPKVRATVTGYQPPLPFDDDAFDCVYSISIWTHLPIALQLPWLVEIKRVLRPGGLALISTSGPHVVEVRRKRGDQGWQELEAEDLVEAGVIFRAYHYSGLRGIDSAYGLAAHDPSFVQRVWGSIMPVLITRARAIEAMQDLHVLTKI
jgi:SAM-dependent methyltransferase